MTPVPATQAVPANALPGKNDHGRQRNMQERPHAEKRSLAFGDVGLRVTCVWRIDAAEPWQCDLRHHAERHHWRSLRMLAERCDLCFQISRERSHQLFDSMTAIRSWSQPSAHRQRQRHDCLTHRRHANPVAVSFTQHLSVIH